MQKIIMEQPNWEKVGKITVLILGLFGGFGLFFYAPRLLFLIAVIAFLFRPKP